MADKRSPLLYLQDILESILNIEQYISDITEQEFIQNQEKQDAVIRRLEIIGEAVKKVPEEIKNEFNNIPWKQIAGMRDVVIHEYFGVSASLIYKTVTSDLFLLKETVETIISNNKR
jgi:uncharacterized protein with HEPN domain